MTNIKKVYVELVELLESNQNKKVSSIMDQVLELATTKQSTKNFLTNDNGEVTHVFCYYHKKWEPLAEVEFGKKKHSASGFNSMCKEGVNQWSKQNRDAKKAEAELLDKVASGELAPDDIQSAREQIQAEKSKIVPREDGIGFDSIDELS